MICPKCGRNIPDGAVCPCSMAQPLSSNPAVNTLKTLGSSTLFLVLAVLLSVVPLLSILGQMMVRTNIGDLMYYAMQLDLDPSVLYPAVDALSRISLPGAVLSCVPAILIAVGVWMTYASCRSTQSGNVSTAGLTICKVLSIITLVCEGILSLLVAVGIVVLMAAGAQEFSYSYYDGMYYDYDGMGEAIMVVLAVFLVIFAAVMALMIIYQACIIKAINRIKATAITGVPDNRIPGFLIVMNYIAAAGCVFTGFSGLLANPASSLGSFVSAASLVLASLVLSKYRSGMTLLMYPPVQPVYPQQPMPPQGPWA